MSKIIIKNIIKAVKTGLLILLIITLPTISLSQTSTQGYVDVKGKVRFEKKGLPGVSIEIFDGPSKINSVTSESTGRFKFKLRIDKIYVIYFKKKDFVTKKVEFNTSVEEKDIMWQYQFDLELFEMMDGLDISVLDKPVAKVVYDEKIGDFDFDESYSQKIKANITKMMNQQKALKRNQYNNLIASADNNYRNKNYEKAIDLYEKALDIDPYADYPFNQIDKCDEMLKRPVVNDNDYKKAVQLADAEFRNKNYDKAITLYENALDIDPYNDYPDNQIDKCEKLLSQQKNSEKEYNKAIALADKSFSNKDYENAKNNYKEASGIKPNESYPKKKIAEIDELLSNLALQNQKDELDKNYNDKITEADKLLKQNNLKDAKQKYNEALVIKSNEQYPKDKIAEIDKQIAQLKETANKKENYDKLIVEGDRYFKSNQYNDAKNKYQEALQILPGEIYPKTKITEIDKIIAEQKAKEDAAAKELAAKEAAAAAALAAKQKLDADYKNIIAEADGLFKTKSYDNAKGKYNEALKLKQEQYPKDKIAEIDKIIAEQKAKEDAAAKELAAKEAAAAAALAAKQKLDADYKNIIAEADGLFKTKSYDNAKGKYNEALKLKQEQYPKDKIAEIDKIIAEQKAKEDAAAKELAAKEAAAAAALAAKQKLDADYKKLIADADNKFISKNYEDAKAKYNAAIKLKEEQYPKDKVAEINKILAEKAKVDALNNKYNSLLADGNKLLKSLQYDDAKAKYNEALKLKPDSDYPKTKIAEIEKLKAQREIDKKYLAEVKKADNLFNAKKYNEAKNAYGSASKIKPSEGYPKKKILEIQGILSGQTAENTKPKEEAKLQDLSKLSSTEKSHYLNSLAKKYPKGKTVEEFSESNGKKITRIIMSDGNIAHEYRKVVQPWGATYYFKDGKNVSNAIFFQETQE